MRIGRISQVATWATIAVVTSLLPRLQAQQAPTSPAAPVAATATWSALPSAPPATLFPAPYGGSASSSFPRFELFAGYSYFRELSNSANRIAWLSGLSTSFAINANRTFGIVFDFAGYRATRFGPGAPPTGGIAAARGKVFSYMVGPRVSFRHHRFTPFVQALFGEMDARTLTLQNCNGGGCTPLPSQSAFAVNLGGGLDYTLTHHLAWRVIQAEYALTRFRDPTTFAGQRSTQNDIRLSTGLVFRFGDVNPAEPAASQPLQATCSADPTSVVAGSGDPVVVQVDATDPNRHALTYGWTANAGTVEGAGSQARWHSAGVEAGNYTVTSHVDNGHGETTDCATAIQVTPAAARPVSLSCAVDPSSIAPGDSAQITATADNPDGNPLTYTWTTSAGQIVGSGPSVSFDSTGLEPGSYTANGHADDGHGQGADCSVAVEVAALPVVLEHVLALHSIYFPTNQPSNDQPDFTGIAVSQQAILKTLASDFLKFQQFKPDAHLTLEGHADDRASAAYNQALAERRVALSKSYLVSLGVPEADIATHSFGKREQLDATQVRAQMEANPDLSPSERDRLLANLPSIILAQNRRVDIVLTETGQTSERQYPFNAKDALTLLNDKALNH
ncbi:MAG TPA: OmpA family protein [Terriglobales bacterium]|nr:OmpA family protein [Terriglobales bacterium]